MNITDKDVKKLAVLGIAIFLAVLVFFLIKPIILSIVGGLILAYIFMPVYQKSLKYIKNKSVAASIATIFAILIIVIPLYFIFPPAIQQTFKLFTTIQDLDLSQVVRFVFPSSSDQLVAQLTATMNSFVSNVSSGAINSLISFFLELPTLVLNLFLLGFVFFFTLRDHEKHKEFIMGISPFSKRHERQLVKQFKNITDSILFGQIVIGIIQGIVAGLGLLLFGIPNALLFTILSVILGIIPIIGPGFVWIPITIYLFSQGQIFLGLGFLAYNAIITSTVDNIIRPYIIARRSETSALTVLIGMISGLFLFGILGVILGPLIISYFLTLIRAYKDRNLSSLFEDS